MVDRKGTKGTDGGLPEALTQKQPITVYTTWPDMIKHWPKTTFCIVSNEFCERFSYYGMRTVLTFYILNVLKFSKNTSTVFFNSFGILCYLTPIGGSIIADGYIGKFWTIFSVSILYAIGQVMLAIASVQNFKSSVHPVMDLVGLLVIAFGTGGIKPCVAAFGGDQFDKGQERMLSVYFSMFYFSINAGSMISTFISPIFRARPCLGQDSCYPLAFGIPAVLMLVATGLFLCGVLMCPGLFMLGSFWYKKPPPSENVFAQVGRIIFGAIGNKIAGRGPSRPHWLEHYLDTHHCEADEKCIALQERTGKNKCFKKKYVEDVKSLLRVLVMFLPVPVFWALYDQQGSIWLIQGIQMNCEIFGGILLLPDQMQTLNAVLILVFIPLFQVIVYPLFSKCITLTPLRKIVAGGWLAALSFVVTGLVQVQVNKTLPALPDSGSSYVSFMNIYDAGCNITVTPVTDTSIPPVLLLGNTSMVDNEDAGTSTFHIKSGTFAFSVDYAGLCQGNEGKQDSVTYDFADTKVFYVAVGPLGIFKGTSETEKPTEGTGEFNFGIVLATQTAYNGNLALCRTDAVDYDKDYPCDPNAAFDFYFWETDYNDHTNDIDSNIPLGGLATATKNISATVYVYKPVKPGSWELFFMHSRPKDVDNLTPPKQNVSVTTSGIKFQIAGQGGVYTMVVTGPGDGTARNDKHIFQAVQDNRVSILWQVPQIVILTAAEILFSITGYEFAYSQSAPSMKALVQAMWLFTTAVGDSIIVAITASQLFTDMAVEFFAYAGAMFVVICIFALLAIFYYEYTYFTKADEEDKDDEEIDSSLDNEGFVPDKRRPSEGSESESIKF